MAEVNGFLLVEVPEGIKTFGIGIAAMYKGRKYISYDTEHSFDDERIYLPPGNYSIVGLAKDASDEIKSDIVSDKHGRYPDFQVGVLDEPCFYFHTEPSFESLLKSHSLELSTTLILKKL